MDGMTWSPETRSPDGPLPLDRDHDTGRDRSLPVVPQHTIRNTIDCTGVGLHGGRPARLVLRPAAPGTGILFRRTDLPADAGPNRDIPARADRVIDTRLCTTLANAEGVSVATVEHLMAALAAAGIDNLLVEVDGPEVPIMDGSAQPFLFLIDCAGLQAQAAPRRALRILKPITITDGPVSARLAPAERGLSIRFEIAFAAEAIGHQSCAFGLSDAVFRRHLSTARTFGLREDVERLHAAGLALGGSLDNAVVVDGDRVLNDGGLRFDDEFVRHKALDAVGDLYMVGLPLIGQYLGVRSSHHHNNLLLRALLDDPTAWRIETATPASLTPAGGDAFHARRETRAAAPSPAARSGVRACA